MRFSHIVLLASFVFAHPAFAQDADRFEQIEQDMMLLKKKLDRVSAAGGTSAPAPSAGGSVSTAQVDVRISALEEEIRTLRGRLEEKEFETRQLSEEFQKFKKDTEFRMGELETRPITPPAVAEDENEEPAAAEEKPVEKPKKFEPAPKKKAELSVKEVPTPAEEADTDAPGPGETPRDHYNYAFRLLNQNQYEQAAKSFAAFTKKYPKDPLVGNAYYWQGETHYIRKDYASAIEQFRLGYEAMPKGPKAPDNLLKLGMSLAAMKKKDEACIVLSQVMGKFKASAANTSAKAQAEFKRNNCE
jgi:tol-pal system protein YbgF